ncbi:dihydrolipoyl dehydrogenase [Acetobacter orleanensis]|uniref:Dihydrolipoyl dehydrogenase n=1 Tax=Acetobacter orleanensis TaxID=104099 RepID=A0A4Y3TH47_9PROT|nr:dihydrolipoyl dehydrogenase [Acetobacter orleanensis]KXV63109.1 dihydrolipoamide dehydrogenase [Acetobacter orleanensis]PCD80265.1 dihydrolipoyl dehydrogenase [Acetobacter orleanensis]GAN68996.1 dihydrolipoamide dehydrogenase [Acetobacter orleanensis JCM 7639]GBR30479.1 dihydrolipoamide dehydrogenase [Acetobacter orleanensis NRIC 0473]GEB81596.1 dihydrolipoyl dehydrogenase [Acetobacter orleanensis]
MSATNFDIIIVGGGPGGYVAALRAAQLGLSAAVVEAKHLGGICLNWGCIPTKALLRASEINHLLHDLGPYGFSAEKVSFDFSKIVARSRAVSKQLSGGVAHLLKKAKVPVFEGYGKLDGVDGAKRKVLVTPEKGAAVTLTAKHVILATGARARTLPGLEPDGKLVWSYREALVPEALPRRLLVIGSGAIGSEFASFYRNMGSEVTLVEVAPRILPVEDEEISALARKAFEKQGIRVLTSAKIGALRKSASDVTVPVEVNGKTEEFTVDRVISAVGIVGNVENIGLEGTKVKTDRTHVVTDALCRTGEPGVYAIGDLAGAPWLAHKASHEAVMCVEAIAGKHVHPIDSTKIPGCTYCRPQIASVGYTEARAKEAGYKVRVGKFPLMANGKALAMGEPEGLVKTVFDAQTGELLGAHMIGAEVTEMIQGYVIARTGELTEAELAETIFPHPTISESMHEAVLAAYDGALHF